MSRGKHAHVRVSTMFDVGDVQRCLAPARDTSRLLRHRRPMTRARAESAFVIDAHRGDGKRIIVRAENSLFACPHLLSAVRVSSLFQVLHGFRVADSVDRIISIISLSL